MLNKITIIQTKPIFLLCQGEYALGFFWHRVVQSEESFHYDVTSLLDRVAVIDLLAGGHPASQQKRETHFVQQPRIC